MPRFALRIEYDGGPFAGWQAQADRASVQGEVERALAALDPGFRAGARIAAAGRTDAGVHATGQVAHADLARDWDPFRLAEALNWHLKPAPVAVLAAARVQDDFHARFSAQGRRYLFRLLSRRAPATHDRGRVWQVAHPLDAEAMRQGAAHLVGRHDFTTFRSAHCQADSPVRTLDLLSVERIGERLHIRAAARSFLHHQVRSMVGCLALVGMGRWTPDDVGTALAAQDRARLGLNAPSDGLFFVRADYPDDA